jgi:hypothetical protein
VSAKSLSNIPALSHSVLAPPRLVSFEINFGGYIDGEDGSIPLTRFLQFSQGLEELYILFSRIREKLREEAICISSPVDFG